MKKLSGVLLGLALLALVSCAEAEAPASGEALASTETAAATTAQPPAETTTAPPAESTAGKGSSEKTTAAKPTTVQLPTTVRVPTTAQLPLTALDAAALEGVYRAEDNTKNYDLVPFALTATPEDQHIFLQIVRSVAPSFDPAEYECSQLVRDQGGSFFVEYSRRLQGYVTSKGYCLYFEEDQAVWLQERGVTLSVPSSAVIAKLPPVTGEMVQAAYRQGREEVYARNPRFVVQEQSGSPFYNLAAGECVYHVKTVYSTDETGVYKGVVDTKYPIAMLS